MLGGATVGCVQSVDDDAGDVALTGSMGRSDLLLRLMIWLTAVCSWYERCYAFVKKINCTACTICFC